MTHKRRSPSWLAPVGFCLAAALSTSAGAQPGPERAPTRFEQWRAALERHTPGDPGLAAVEVSTWSARDLDGVVAEAKRHARTVARTDPEGANGLLLRGARLHADIGRLIPDDPARRSDRQKSVYVIRDGRWLGQRYISLHWQLGRALLDGVLPDPAAHEGVRDWYRTTSLQLLDMRSLAEAVDHLARGRQIFPDDAVLLYCSGALHERFASSGLQSASAALVEENRQIAAVSSVRGELTRAERFFRAALASDPGHLEARVRHGRVLGELGRPDEAASALKQAIAGGPPGELMYLAQLFLGRQEERLGRTEEARAAFERAAALYPRAQTPRLALSHLALRSGDRQAAQRELQIVAALPADERRREDPWWSYHAR